MRSAYCLHSWRRPQLIHSADGSRVESSAAPTLIKKEDEGVVERTKFHFFCLSISENNGSIGSQIQIYRRERDGVIVASFNGRLGSWWMVVYAKEEETKCNETNCLYARRSKMMTWLCEIFFSPCWSCRCLPDETRRSFKSVGVEDGEKVMSLATAAREMMKILCSRVLALRRRKWVISPVERMSAFHELGTKWEKRGRRGRVSLTQSRFTTCSLQTLFSSFRHCRDQNSRWNEKSGQNKNLAWKEEGKKTKLRN